MIRSDDPGFEQVELDGQLLLIPSDIVIGSLRNDPTLDGRPVGVGRFFEQFSSLSANVRGLRVGLGAVIEPNQPWMVYLLAEHAGGWMRIKVEGQKCDGCGWTGLTGNARDFNLYIGTPDPLAAMQRHWESAVGCPGCGVSFARPAVWAGESP